MAPTLKATAGYHRLHRCRRMHASHMSQLGCANEAPSALANTNPLTTPADCMNECKRMSVMEALKQRVTYDDDAPSVAGPTAAPA